MKQPLSKHLVRSFHNPVITLSIILLGVFLCSLGLLLLAGYHSKIALATIKSGNTAQVERSIEISYPIVSTYNTLTFGLIPDFVVWKTALQTPLQINELVKATSIVAKGSFQETNTSSIASLKPHLSAVQASIEVIDNQLPKTFFLKNSISSDYLEIVAKLADGLQDASLLVDTLSQGQQTWVAVLQNSDELRATGGFPGSYVLLNFNEGVLAEIVVEDIYDADGQFKGYIAAPSGIREYTSGNRGLRLPDANWWPDFPQSAQTMLQFFALGEKNNIAGVIAINLDTARAILEITGPVWLPDYNIEVNANNVSEVLRAERSDFFPGSTQKKDLLSQTFSQLKQKVSNLDNQQQLQLMMTLIQKTSQKEMQVFSTRPELQTIFSKHQLAGEINEEAFQRSTEKDLCNCKPLLLSLVESNVGINKVNKYVQRSTQLAFAPQKLSITTTFSNHASPLTSTELSQFIEQPSTIQPRNGNGYLNYYRLLISPEYKISSITHNGVPFASWDDEIITTFSHTEMRQIGVLVAVPEKQTESVTFNLGTNREFIPEALYLYKQSGVLDTLFTLTTPGITKQFQLNSDTIVLLNQ